MHAHQTIMSFGRERDPLGGRGVERRLLRRVLGLCRPYRGLLIGFLMTVIASAAVTVIPPLLFRSLLDSAVPHKDRALVFGLTGAAVGVALAAAGLSLVQRWLSARIGEGLIYDMRVDLFDHVQRLPQSFFTRTQTGALMSRLNNDVIGAQQAVTNTLGTVVSNTITLVVTLGVMLGLEWRLTILTLLVLPAFVVPARRIGRRLQTATREAMQQNASMNNVVVERFNVSGALVAKLFGHPARDRAAFAEKAAAVRDIGVTTAMYSRVLFAALALVAAVGSAVVYWIGGLLAIDRAITVGTVAAFMLYVTQIYQPLTQLTNARVDVMTALVSFERVFEILDFPAAIVDRPGAVDLVAPRGRVDFDHVWFHHPDPTTVTLPSLEATGPQSGADSRDTPTTEPWTLRDVTFTIEPGTLVAVVGPSGAGKTTLASLVPRLADVVQGAVRIDGRDVRELTLESLRGAVGVVTQDPHLFHDTIAENLRYAKPDATLGEMRDACRAAHIADLVEGLPGGYDTVVGERGYRMSGGEKQRLAIARVLMADPTIVILDEATAHLDSESEQAIQRALAEALKGRSALVIAHRLSTVAHADRIVVLDEGAIVEEGTHEELLTRDGLYAALVRLQTERTAAETP